MRLLLRRLDGLFERRVKRALGIAVLGLVVVALLDTFAIALVLPLVDLATGRGDESGAVMRISEALGEPSTERLTLTLTVAVVALFILKDIGALVFAWWMNGFVASERVRTSARILKHVLNAPYTEVSARSSAEIIRTTDAAVLQVFSYTVSGLMFTASSAISIVTMLVALMLLAPIPTLVLVVYFGLAMLLFDKVAKPRSVAAGEIMIESSMQGLRTALGAIGALKELKLRGTQQHFVDNYEQAQLRGAYAGRTATFISGLPRYLLEILFISMIGLVTAAGASQSGSGAGGGPLGLLALFVAAGFRLLPAVSALSSNVSNIRVGSKSLELVHAEVVAARRFDLEAERTPPPGRVAPLPFNHRLAIESVYFRYPTSEAEVLQDVCLELPRGGSLALVGGSGAGKTTLVDLILGLHTPTRGRITVDGRDIADNIPGWQQWLAYVAQDIFLLDASLAENVAFDQPVQDIDRARVLLALTRAQLGDVVNGLPDGLETQLGERGARLSGGQRQRIGIARALYRDCQVLVLDEATSALDNETEHRINQTVAGLQGDMTVIVIAHRLSTVRHAQQVAFMDRGRVECVGTFEEVRNENEKFARLVELGSLKSPAEASDAPLND